MAVNKKLKTENKSDFQVMIPFESQARETANASRLEMSRGGEVRLSDRRSSSSGVTLKDQLCNIDEGILPFTKCADGLSVQDSVILCQKAYFNIAIFRNTIDTQSEFANSSLHFKGGTAKSRAFYKAWWKKINGFKLSQGFFLEWYRSANIPVYKTYSKIDAEDLRKLKNEFGSEEIPNNLLGKEIPLRYILLNPACISARANLSFSDSNYYKVLNSYEMDVLRNAKTPEQKKFLASLPQEARNAIKLGGMAYVQLDPSNFSMIFAKKQDYEPMAVPMYYPVLFDINLKLEFKKAEIAIARQIDYMILLITLGDKDNGVDVRVQNAMQEMFKKDSVGRVIVADYTTKMEFIVPDFTKIMGPDKYEVVNKDIASGLMNVFFEDSKFASGLIKTKIFLERLNEARKAFINDFLIPEMEAIAETLGFRGIPQPQFEEINLEDKVQSQKIYSRLVELGVLSPKEFFEISETGILPDSESNVEAQRDFKKLRDEGLYEPLIGGMKEDEAGRPDGAKSPQTTKTVSPQKSVGKFSLFKIKEVSQDISRLIEKVESQYKSVYGHKRLSAAHKKMAFEFAKSIIIHEDRKNWDDSIDKHMNEFVDSSETFDKINEIAVNHNVDLLNAAILFHSPYDDQSQTN